MTRLDDAALAAHLGRRAQRPGAMGERERDARLWSIVLARLDAEVQTPGWRLARPRWARLATVAGLAALLAGAGLVTLPIGDQAPSATPDRLRIQVLNADELGSLVDEASWHHYAGRAVIVSAELNWTANLCLPSPDCILGFFASSPAPTFLRAGESSGDPVNLSPPLAVRVRGLHEVDLIGPARLPADSGAPWTLPALIAEQVRYQTDRAAGLTVYPVDSWLSHGFPSPSCPAPIDESGNIVEPGPFGCGDAAWLAPDATQPTRVTRSETSTSYAVSPPEGALRVQNGAYQQFAPDLGLTDADGLPTPQRAIYLTRRAASAADPCFLCEGTPRAEVVARLDPVIAPDTSPATAP